MVFLIALHHKTPSDYWQTFLQLARDYQGKMTIHSISFAGSVPNFIIQNPLCEMAFFRKLILSTIGKAYAKSCHSVLKPGI